MFRLRLQKGHPLRQSLKVIMAEIAGIGDSDYFLTDTGITIMNIMVVISSMRGKPARIIIKNDHFMIDLVNCRGQH
ncbi:MAG: hypothetical protein ABJA70_18195 [Chryseolinea sp.]